MSWMTPVAAASRHRLLPLDCAQWLAASAGVVAEQLLDPVPALLQPVQRQAEVGDGVPDHVVGRRRRPAATSSPRCCGTGRRPRRASSAASSLGALVDLDQQDLR